MAMLAKVPQTCAVRTCFLAANLCEPTRFSLLSRPCRMQSCQPSWVEDRELNSVPGKHRTLCCVIKLPFKAVLASFGESQQVG